MRSIRICLAVVLLLVSAGRAFGQAGPKPCLRLSPTGL
jgi:hypothetical protein